VTPDTTALLLIGYQDDYYSPEGALHHFLEDSASVRNSLERTVSLVQRLSPTSTTIIETLVGFSNDYAELKDPVGILAAIRDSRALAEGTWGAARVPELAPYHARIISLPGKRGFSAFTGTRLDDELRNRSIVDLVLCGSVASVCIDSTARAGVDRGYRVSVLSDCITSRTQLEKDFYFEQVFPLYADVVTSEVLGQRLLAG
jgi:nicotinamidase-related amidase